MSPGIEPWKNNEKLNEKEKKMTKYLLHSRGW